MKQPAKGTNPAQAVCRGAHDWRWMTYEIYFPSSLVFEECLVFLGVKLNSCLFLGDVADPPRRQNFALAAGLHSLPVISSSGLNSGDVSSTSQSS
ncbi:hypothetical protein Nepgr_031349 [Nepenthes gracilis]|uniref:Uncharacterized protein n=1 Tax=Nepenthes gracilis TaxID=150966 RepID=A0AAD3Y7F9_NEPGR|nr:hypothetical protein Nepgr_031349 [Nepenthes gracilis]